jgi:Rab interacting lysosomal protein.
MEDASFNEKEDTANSSFTELTTSICLTSDESSEKASSVIEADQPPPRKKDPNRPRYTLKEMQSLLEERNMYKIKMMAMEEELQLYKEGYVIYSRFILLLFV